MTQQNNRHLTLPRLAALVSVLIFCLPIFFGCAASRSGESKLDAAWYAPEQEADTEAAEPYKGVTRQSFYLTMCDGVRIAVDLYLPANLKPVDKIPCILMQTRYFRYYDFHWPVKPFLGTPDELKKIVEHGYALVRLDARGSGASFGTRPCPWSQDEVRDGGEVVDWIISQPWSNGRVGAAGGSYEGTTAEFLMVNQHPAVKAVAPMYALYDVYTDIAFPGGIHLTWFTHIWELGCGAMDVNRLGDVSWYAPFLLDGVMPVDGDEQKVLLRQAVAEHAANYKVHREALQIIYRDDVSNGGISMDRFSPHTYREQIEASGTAVYNYSGWFDGGYSHSAIKRYLTMRGPHDRLILGPWDHGGDDHVRQFGRPVKTKFDHLAELQRFFDYHLTGIDTGIYDEKPVHYYTMGEDKWKSSNTWPPPEAVDTPFHLSDGSLLETIPSAEQGNEVYLADLTAGTGDKTRWNCLALGMAVKYPDRKYRDRKLLVFETAPLTEDIEVTGHPIVTLYVSSDKTDGEFFVYLEDVDQNGDVGYITEGMLRAIHRKLSTDAPYETPTPYRTYLEEDAMPLVPGEVTELTFDLLPTSYLFRQGHRIRIAIACADADLFRVLHGNPPTIRVHFGPDHPSRIVLPIVPR